MTGIDPRQLLDLVIRPTLDALALGCPAVEQLLLGTALQESDCGRYLQQLGGGPALGVFQMEVGDHDDIWANFLPGKPDLAAKVKALLPAGADRRGQLVTNLAYAAAMCRVHYLRVRDPLPPSYDVEAQAAYYKAHYNGPGAATTDQYIANWKAAMGGSSAA